MDLNDNKKDETYSELLDFDGKIESKQFPFLNFIKYTIIVSLFAALYMLIL